MSASRIIKGIVIVILLLLGVASIKAYKVYRSAFKPNILLEDKTGMDLYIPTGASFEQVYHQIAKSGILMDTSTFLWAAKKKNYPAHVYPGRYIIENRMSNNDLVNLLRSGKQTPVNVTFNNQRTLDELAERISGQLEPTKDEFLDVFIDNEIIEKFGFNKETFKCNFIPNTYEIWWNTSPEKFVARMNAEYEKFWKGKRDRKAESVGFTREEIITLASIVQQETRMNDEKPTIAGVYINRLNKGIKLDADPTVVYANGDFTRNRVLNKDRQIDSPYNTYKYRGLPPGPICIPDISSIDAVLNYEKHKYLFFCAKPDFSGYHNFAKTNREHNKNAAAYRKELNKRKIYR